MTSLRPVRRVALLCALSGVCGMSAALAQPFVAINTSPTPDQLRSFDAATPTTNSIVDSLTGNFIRGFELASEKLGYYVATSTLSGSPTGFYEWNDGTETLIAPLPYTSTAGGGLSFDETQTFLYYIIDADGSNSEENLFRLTLDGTFTLVGEISGFTLPSPAVVGAAVSPDGTLYVIDATSDSLYTVDRTTAVATLVGALTDPIGASIGGLDFAPDGRLFASYNTGDFFEVDPATGATTFVGDLGFGTSGISAVPGDIPLPCPADFNDDGFVDDSDFVTFAAAYEAFTIPPADPIADLNSDGFVDDSDFVTFAAAYEAFTCR